MTRREVSDVRDGARPEASDWWLVRHKGTSRVAPSASRPGCRSTTRTGSCTTATITTAILRSRTSFGDRSGLSVSYLWKEFGANEFYGGNAPSREWTNQTLVAGDHRFGEVRGWSIDGQASYRTHGDRFLFNQLMPALSDNRHRTHAVLVSASGARPVAGRGSLTRWRRRGRRLDSLHQSRRSRDLAGQRVWRVAAGGRLGTCSSTRLLRVDRYAEFGTSWNPSVGVGWWATPSVRLRGVGWRGRFACRRSPSATTRIRPTWRGRRSGRRPPGRGKAGADVSSAVAGLVQATRLRARRTATSSTGCARHRPNDGGHTTSATSTRLGVEIGVRKTLRPARSSWRSTPRSTSTLPRSRSCRSTCSTTRRSR